MFITGISDEAGKDITSQIRAHQELKWNRLELRDVSVDGGAANNLHDISDGDFDQVERGSRTRAWRFIAFPPASPIGPSRSTSRSTLPSPRLAVPSRA